jgi:hypothetical protein
VTAAGQEAGAGFRGKTIKIIGKIGQAALPLRNFIFFNNA